MEQDGHREMPCKQFLETFYFPISRFIRRLNWECFGAKSYGFVDKKPKNFRYSIDADRQSVIGTVNTIRKEKKAKEWVIQQR